MELVGIFINTKTYMFDKFDPVWHHAAIRQQGVAYAKEAPVSYRIITGRVR
jgi:hypothetical protein